MSHHARIEELSDTDSDPPEQDLSDFDPRQIIAPAAPARDAGGPTSPSAFNPPPAEMLQPQFQQRGQPADSEKYKHFACIYPLYFDAGRTRAEGRRVGKELAVPNPLAREIVDAAAGLGLNVVFEPGKMHPRDWANPGRVRVGLKDEAGRAKNPRVKNKHHLYHLISAHLKSHPTTADSPMRLRIQGVPTPSKPVTPPAVPRGWKMSSILPLHSPALSGGGVSENFFKEMMAEMQAAQGGGQVESSGSVGEAPAKKKKDKKKGKA